MFLLKFLVSLLHTLDKQIDPVLKCAAVESQSNETYFRTVNVWR